jgi:amino acid adenylation domain-containing protein
VLLHELIRTTAKKHGTTKAVHAWDGSWTYNELQTNVSRLSDYLVTLGVGPDRMVGVCMDKSKWAPVAMLAILHAGGAVVPLGMQHPVSRIQDILTDSAAVLVLSDKQHSERLAGVGPQIISIGSSLLENLAEKPPKADSIHAAVRAEHAAWVIYTSGSTGAPKRVVLEHRALSSSVQAHGPAFGMKPGARMFQFAAHAFDVAIQEICTTLVYGGCICITSEEERIGSLAATIARLQVDTLGLTSSTALLVRPQAVPTVQRLILFGEPVKAAVIEAWQGITILNAYGPSECSIHYTCSDALQKIGEASMIGRPLKGNFWITDPSDYHCLLPIGAPGELLIEGPLLARGYLNDPAKTEAAFVVDPAFVEKIGLHGGRRMYRTGDLVRLNSDGSFTYVGRRDTQVKVRGQRLDVGEVEYWITKMLGDVVTAVVDLIPPGEDRLQPLLVAAMDFVEGSQYGNISRRENSNLLSPSDTFRDAFSRLRESLISKLPAYMVPTAYVPLIKVPLNASGKTDRRAVRQTLIFLTLKELMPYVDDKSAPKHIETESEGSLRSLWSELLQIDEKFIGRHDNFFDLGGDSIMVMKLIAIGASKGTILTVQDVFDAPQLSKMALASKRGTASTTLVKPVYGRFSLLDAPDLDSYLEKAICPLMNVSKNSVIDVLPATDPQALNVAGGLTKKTVEVHYFKLDAKNGPPDLHRLRKACRDLANHLEIFRTAYVFHDEKLLQVVSWTLIQLTFQSWR